MGSQVQKDDPLGLIYSSCCWAEPNVSWDASKQLFATGSVGNQSMVQLWSCNLYYEAKYYKEDLFEFPASSFYDKKDDSKFPKLSAERNIVNLGSIRTKEVIGIAWTSGESNIVAVDIVGTIRLISPSDEGLTLRLETNMAGKGSKKVATAMALSQWHNQIIAISVHSSDHISPVPTPYFTDLPQFKADDTASLNFYDLNGNLITEPRVVDDDVSYVMCWRTPNELVRISPRGSAYISISKVLSSTFIAGVL